MICLAKGARYIVPLPLPSGRVAALRKPCRSLASGISFSAARKKSGVLFFRAAIVHFCRRLVPALGVHNIMAGVFVVVLDPGHAEGEALFVAPFRRDIEEVVRADVDVQAARESGVGVKNVPAFVFIKSAEAGSFFE